MNGEGYIVTEDWVLNSHKRKKKLPWRDYRLGRAKSPPHAKEDDEKVSLLVYQLYLVTSLCFGSSEK